MTEKQIRIQRLEELRKKKINPYPSKSRRTHSVNQVLADFDNLAQGKKLITIVGRLRIIRLHGKSAFTVLQDQTGKIQLYFKKDIVGKNSWEIFELLDIGDIIEARGILFTTKMGEKTLQIQALKLLTKSLLPLPEKWHGLTDVEVRYRQRYLDLISNPEVQAIFRKRSAIIRIIRQFFDKKGYLEVETPILQPIYGGATAQPFVTHHQTLDCDLYLRIAPELYLKRLLVGGFEKVYEISRCFRNEGIDRWHNPEFTQIEFYEAYADYNLYMKLVEKLMLSVVKAIAQDTKITYQEKTIDFSPPYPKITFREALKQYAKIDIDKFVKRSDLVSQLTRSDLQIQNEWGRGEILDEIFKKIVLKNVIQPTFIIDHPIELSPLAKKKASNPNYVERFQLIINSAEVSNAFSELNDPLDQKERFLEQEKLHKAGLKEAQRIDQDFLEALEHGMPPAAGCGIGIDRLAILLSGVHSIKEVILFPTLKPKRISRQGIATSQ